MPCPCLKISDIPAPLLSSLIISKLDREDKKTGSQEISLELNEEALQGKLLLVPVYQASAIPLHRARNLSKFALSPENLDLLQRYLDYVEDNRVFLALHDGYQPEQVSVLQSSITDTQEAFRNLDVLTRQAHGYFSIHSKEFSKFKELEAERSHIRSDVTNTIHNVSAIGQSPINTG